ncbi:MAG: PorP/SprF family type IX secretion system membrane protein [Chitinophagaceae bacterium]|nr:PorP/SprF family type IX secretion system membrane protein [Chitinophagaceae bacterium]
MMKKLLFVIALVSGSIIAEAQTYHLSQFYSTPMLVNPATTGNTAGPYRFAANYRSQWKNEGSPYTTFTASGDAHILKNEGGVLGMGLVFLNDKVMDGVVQTNRISFSTGYHIAIDRDNIQKLSVGFQGSYNESRIDFARLQFESQFSEGGYDPSLPIGEEFNNGKKNYFDLNAGAMYSFSLEDKSLFAGVAMYNILKQEESYMTEQFKSPSLLSVMAGGDINVGYNNSFYFSSNYRKQGTTNELTLGAAWGMFIDQTGFTSFRLGMWHRVKDAIIPYAGVTYKGLQVGTSFDYSVSQQKTQSQLRSTFEISVVYTADDKNQLMRVLQWY